MIKGFAVQKCARWVFLETANTSPQLTKSAQLVTTLQSLPQLCSFSLCSQEKMKTSFLPHKGKLAPVQSLELLYQPGLWLAQSGPGTPLASTRRGSMGEGWRGPCRCLRFSASISYASSFSFTASFQSPKQEIRMPHIYSGLPHTQKCRHWGRHKENPNMYPEVSREPQNRTAWEWGLLDHPRHLAVGVQST